MNKKVIFTISKKEFFNYINSALAYVVIVPFLLISIFLYFRSALLMNQANLRPYFEILPWFLLFIAPALSMKLLTEEKNQDTLELLFSHPISEWDIVLGKFLGALAFFGVVLLTTIGMPLTLIKFSNPDIGIFVGQYLGALFLGANFLAMGIAMSTYIKSAIGSFLAAAFTGFALMIVGMELFVLMVPWPFNRILPELSLLNHVSSVSRGLIDIRDVAYFVSSTALFLTAAVIKLSKRKTEEDEEEKKKLNIVFALVVGIGILVNVFLEEYPVRLDLTRNKRFTLTDGTKQTLEGLPDLVTINLYASQALPAPAQITLQEIQDILRDYERASDNIKVNVKDPTKSADMQQEAVEAGVREVTFNQIGTGKFEVQGGFLGLAVRFGDETESIPFIQDTSDLEYQLTRRIRKLTRDEDVEVGIYSNDMTNQTRYLFESLSTEYTAATIADFEQDLSEKDALIVMDSGMNEEATAAAKIKEYVDDGGKVFIMANGVNVNPQTLTTTESQSEIVNMLSDYGVELKKDIVYDIELSESVTMGQDSVRYVVPYPFWLRALPTEEDISLTSAANSVLLAWPSTVDVEEKDGYSYKRILETSENANRQEGSFTIDPNALKDLEDPLKEKIGLSVLVENEKSKILVVGDAVFAGDQFVTNNPENMSFIIAGVDYLVADADMAAIPSKDAGEAVFKFTEQWQPAAVQYGNVLVPSVGVALFAVYWLQRRRKLSKRKYR